MKAKPGKTFDQFLDEAEDKYSRKIDDTNVDSFYPILRSITKAAVKEWLRQKYQHEDQEERLAARNRYELAYGYPGWRFMRKRCIEELMNSEDLNSEMLERK